MAAGTRLTLTSGVTTTLGPASRLTLRPRMRLPGRESGAEAGRGAARRLRRKRPRAPEHSTRQRHGQGSRQRHSGGHTVWVAGARCRSIRSGNFVAEEILPDGHAHRRSRGARRGRQRQPVPARPGVQAKGPVLRRHRGPHVLGEPHQRTRGAAAGRERAVRLRLVAGRPAGVLRERQSSASTGA